MQSQQPTVPLAVRASNKENASINSKGSSDSSAIKGDSSNSKALPAGVDGCNGCVEMKNALINAREDKREYEQRYNSLQDEGSRLYEAYTVKCSRTRELSARQRELEAVIAELKEEKQELTSHYENLLEAYKQLEEEKTALAEQASPAEGSKKVEALRAKVSELEKLYMEAKRKSEGSATLLQHTAQANEALKKELAKLQASQTEDIDPQGDGPSPKQLAKELATLKEKEKELSASLKMMEENLLVARKEKEDIVQFGELERQTLAEASEELEAKCSSLTKRLHEEEALRSHMEEVFEQQEKTWSSSHAGLDSERKALNDKLRKLQQSETLLSVSVEEQKKRLEEQDDRLVAQEAQVSSLQKELAQAKDSVSSLAPVAQRVETAEAAALRAEQGEARAREKLQKTENTLRTVRGELQEISEKYARLSKAHSKATRDLEGAATHTVQMSELEVDLRRQLAKSEQVSSRRSGQIKTLSTELKAAVNAHTKAKAALGELQEAKRAVERELAAAVAQQGANETAEESLRSKLERTVARNAELEKNLNALSSELDTLKTEAVRSDGRLIALNEELARLQSRERVLNEENRGLVEDNQRIKTAAEKVVAQMTGMKELSKKAEFYESQKVEFEKERKAWMQELAGANKRLEAMKLLCDQNAKTPTKKKLAKMIKTKGKKSAEVAKLRSELATCRDKENEIRELLMEYKQKSDERVNMLEEELTCEKQKTQDAENLVRQMSIVLCRHKEQLQNDPELAQFLDKISS